MRYKRGLSFVDQPQGPVSHKEGQEYTNASDPAHTHSSDYQWWIRVFDKNFLWYFIAISRISYHLPAILTDQKPRYRWKSNSYKILWPFVKFLLSKFALYRNWFLLWPWTNGSQEISSSYKDISFKWEHCSGFLWPAITTVIYSL